MINLIAPDIFSESQYQESVLGAKGFDEYGDVYRYVQNGGVALVTSNLLQEAAEDTNFRSMAVSGSPAIGTDEVSVTLGGTAVTANMFDNGQLWVESSTGIGQQFRIKRHQVQATTTGVCKFTLDRPLKIALVTATSQVSVRKNAYDGVIQFPTTPTGGAVGVALQAMTAEYFGWIKSGGDCPVLFDNQENSAADANALKPSEDVAGSVAPKQEADVATPDIGWSREMVSVDSTMGMAHLIID
jgi:hypothetical protein